MITTTESRGLLHRSRDAIFRDLGSECMLIRLTDEIIHNLNPFGRKVWELLVQPKTTDEIIDALHARYVFDRDALSRKVRREVADFLATGLVRVEPDVCSARSRTRHREARSAVAIS